ncbi:MAG: hypothetical protein J2P37_34390, partial [Ktedonobacteraceae bacterium]|nr:hypothetical protein [Ktedonobacteraceae bacterium]
RQLVRQAEPVLFLTLTKAGKTVEQARRALTTFLQALRRGSKGRGKGRIGAREAYLVEYFGVLERHHDFERNGFHWHLLINGVDYLPHAVLKELWISATRGKLKGGEADEKEASIVHIERIRNARAIGYVTKYLTKAVTIGERGRRQVQRERLVVVEDEQGQAHTEMQTFTEEVTSKAHRICYSHGFFPARVADLRKRLFAGLEESEEEDNSKPIEGEETEERRGWRLVERCEAVEEAERVKEYKQQRYAEVAAALDEVDQCNEKAWTKQKRLVLADIVEEARALEYEGYQRLKRKVLLEALAEDRRLSRRVINIWDYQRKQLQAVG